MADGSQASFTRYTALLRIRRAKSSPPKRTVGSASRSSCIRGWRRSRRRIRAWCGRRPARAENGQALTHSPVPSTMISTKDLRAIARTRLSDAEVLLAAKRFDGAFYICGYAVELALKARICRTLKWSGFPENEKDFKGFRSVKTHDLAVLRSEEHTSELQSPCNLVCR